MSFVFIASIYGIISWILIIAKRKYIKITDDEIIFKSIIYTKKVKLKDVKYVYFNFTDLVIYRPKTEGILIKCNDSSKKINSTDLYINYYEFPEEELVKIFRLSAIKLLKKDKDATMIVLPSDHYIDKEKEFIETVQQAVEIVEKRRGLATIGITPTRPETGYGYIEMGTRINSNIPTYKVERFVEKPNLEVARDFLRKGTYLWNSGMFVWRADVFLREVEKYLPKMYKSLMEIYQAVGTEKEDEIIRYQYNLIDGISVDFGVMQKTRKGYVVKCKFTWEDIGSFNSLSRFLRCEKTNKTKGNTFLEQCENISIFGDKKLIIGFGVKDLLIVDSGDIILIMDRNKDQEIKQLLEDIKSEDEFKNYL